MQYSVTKGQTLINNLRPRLMKNTLTYYDSLFAMHSPALGMQCSIVKKKIQRARPCGSLSGLLAPGHNAMKRLYEVSLKA